MKVTVPEKRRYVLAKAADLEVLACCKRLEKLKLKKSDKDVVKLIKTQLEKDWRKPLLQKLNSLLKKYKKVKK